MPSATLRPVGGRREKGGDPGAPGAKPLGERALGNEIDFELTGEGHGLEDLVFADVGRDHLFDLLVLEQIADPEVGHAGVVADAGKVARPLVPEGQDEILGDAAQTEAGQHDGGAIRDVPNSLCGILDDLVHGSIPVPLSGAFRASARRGT